MAKPNIDKIIEAINKGFKKGPVAAPLSEGIRSDIKNVIPTGIDAIDKYVLEIGGLPCGRMTELFAEEGVGKTSLALAAVAGAQKAGGVAYFAETECGLTSDRPAVFGVDWDQVILLQPNHWGEVIQQAQAVLNAHPRNTPGLFVLDSVAATPSREEAAEGISDKPSFDKRAKDISQFMRVLGPLAVEKQIAFLFINQVRAKIGVLFGPKTETPGGHAMKFHSSVRLCMYSGKSIKGVGDQHIGKFCSVQAVKSRFSPPWRKAKLKLDYTSGWDNEWAILNHAKELKLIKPRVRKVEEAIAALEENGWSHRGGEADEVDFEDEFDE